MLEATIFLNLHDNGVTKLVQRAPSGSHYIKFATPSLVSAWVEGGDKPNHTNNKPV